jgi:hypothetical protein
VPKTHQMSYRKRPERRMLPVLNESRVRKQRALYENESARTSVSRADLRAWLEPKVYTSEGTAPRGMRKRVGVRSEEENSSGMLY